MNQLANIVDRIDSFHQSPFMVAASQAYATLQAAARAFQAVRDAAAAELASLGVELQALPDAGGQAHATRASAIGAAIADLHAAGEALQLPDQREATAEDVLTLLSSSADALRELA